MFKCLVTGALVTIQHEAIDWAWEYLVDVLNCLIDLCYRFEEMRRKDWYATVKHSNIGANIFLLIGCQRK